MSGDDHERLKPDDIWLRYLSGEPDIQPEDLPPLAGESDPAVRFWKMIHGDPIEIHLCMERFHNEVVVPSMQQKASSGDGGSASQPAEAGLPPAREEGE